MLSQDERRQLALLEQHLRRADPAFAARMRGTAPHRLPLAPVLASVLVWTAAVALLAVGWWPVAIAVSVWAGVLSGASVYRWRQAARRSTSPQPAW